MNDLREALDVALAKVTALRLCGESDQALRARLLDELHDALTVARRLEGGHTGRVESG